MVPPCKISRPFWAGVVLGGKKIPNNNIDEMIILLKNIKNNIEKYYKINENLLNNYNVKNRN